MFNTWLNNINKKLKNKQIIKLINLNKPRIKPRINRHLVNLILLLVLHLKVAVFDPQNINKII